MKKALLMLLAGVGLSVAANAQLAPGSVAPDWTRQDLNGNWHHLYADLDSGYTVYLDVSAAWCSPCWSYHNSQNLENLYAAHGPAGDNTVRVYFIEGESTNTHAQLYGTVANQNYDGFTQGDWVTGTPYPIIDTNGSVQSTWNQQYAIGYFPTIYMICRDHLIREVGQATTADLWAASQICPSYAPSATYDAKAVDYTGTNYFVCNATPTVKFQNYSTTNNITSADIKIYSGANLLATVPWTGNLAPYAVASVNVPSFAGSAFEPYKFTVTVAGDTYAANDSKDSIIRIYAAANVAAAPYTENFESGPNFPYKFSGDGGIFLYAGTNPPLNGVDGSPTRAMGFNFYNLSANATTEVVIGNFDISALSTPALNFDVAYAQYDNTTNDQLEVLVSDNCGNWTSVYSKSGATLATHAATTSVFTPTAAGDWRHEQVSLGAYASSNNLVIKFKGTSAYGNYAWVDNINLHSATGVKEVLSANSINIFPNPATDKATLQFSLTEASKVQVEVIDAMGRVIGNVANEHMNAGVNTLSINTANYAAGIYNVKVTTAGNVSTHRLTVVK